MPLYAAFGAANTYLLNETAQSPKLRALTGFSISSAAQGVLVLVQAQQTRLTNKNNKAVCMLTIAEIKSFIEKHKNSDKKRLAEVGVKYYEGRHDILDCQIAYKDSDGKWQIAKGTSDIKITHPFFNELVEQKAQYALSGKDNFVRSDDPELQEYLDGYFGDDFKDELLNLIIFSSVEGDSYFYGYKDADGKTNFVFADGLGVIEVEAREASDNNNYVIYYYEDKFAEGNTSLLKSKSVTRIQVWDENQTYYYKMRNGKITEDETQPINPRPHIIYKENEQDENLYTDTYGCIPFWRLDNNRKRQSDLKPIKALIDDYDRHACGLTNNLVDLAEGYAVVKGFQGESIDDFINTFRTKKAVGIDEDGEIDIKTVQIPYEARKAKMDIDKECIYQFGKGFNASQIGDGNITNIVIKSRYALLDMKCNALESNIRKLMRKLIKVVLKEINEEAGKDWQDKDVYMVFDREIITNELDNAQIDNHKAQTQNIKINTLLNIATKLDNDTLMELVCDELDINYEDIKDKLPIDTIDMDAESEALANMSEGAAEKQSEGIDLEVAEDAQQVSRQPLMVGQLQVVSQIIADYKEGKYTDNQAVNMLMIGVGFTEAEAKRLIDKQ